MHNVNLQILSTLNGVLRVKHHSRKFCVKTRTDQRIYNPHFLKSVTLQSLLLSNCSRFGIKNRIIVTSMSTLRYRPYGVSDMLMIGETDDLLHYWSIPLDEREKTYAATVNIATVCEYATLRIAETYILTSFLNKIGETTPYSIGHTWEVYKDLFIVVDKESFNIFWNRHSIECEDRIDVYEDHAFLEMSFFDWLCIDDSVQEAPEIYLQLPLPEYKP